MGIKFSSLILDEHVGSNLLDSVSHGKLKADNPCLCTSVQEKCRFDSRKELKRTSICRFRPITGKQRP